MTSPIAPTAREPDGGNIVSAADRDPQDRDIDAADGALLLNPESPPIGMTRRT